MSVNSLHTDDKVHVGGWKTLYFLARLERRESRRRTQQALPWGFLASSLRTMWNVLISIGDGAGKDVMCESDPAGPAACLGACACLLHSPVTSPFPPHILCYFISAGLFFSLSEWKCKIKKRRKKTGWFCESKMAYRRRWTQLFSTSVGSQLEETPMEMTIKKISLWHVS